MPIEWRAYIADEEIKKLKKDNNCNYVGDYLRIPSYLKPDIDIESRTGDYCIIMYHNLENYRVVDSCDNCKHIYKERAEVGSIEIIYYCCMLDTDDVDDSTPLDHGPVGKCDDYERS